jgi:hypothetical protein
MSTDSAPDSTGQVDSEEAPAACSGSVRFDVTGLGRTESEQAPSGGGVAGGRPGSATLVGDIAVTSLASPVTEPSAPIESWETDVFWYQDMSGRRTRFMPWRFAALNKTIRVVRFDLEHYVFKHLVGAGQDGADARLARPRAVRTACRLAFEARSYTTVRANVAKLTAWWTGLLTAGVLAVVADVHWQLTPFLTYLLLFAGGQALFVAAVSLFERFVFPGVLRWGFGAQRWSHTARLYGRTAVFLTIGLCSLVAVLTLSDRHHHLTQLEKVAVASPLGCLAFVIGLWAAVGVQALGELVRPPLDPYSELPLSLLEAYANLCRAHEWTTQRDEALPRGWERQWVAATLERPARALQTDSGMCARFDGDFSPTVSSALRTEGCRVAAWLHNVQQEVLSPSPDRVAAAQRKLGDGFVAACSLEWSQLQANPPEQPRVFCSRSGCSSPRSRSPSCSATPCPRTLASPSRSPWSSPP